MLDHSRDDAGASIPSDRLMDTRLDPTSRRAAPPATRGGRALMIAACLAVLAAGGAALWLRPGSGGRPAQSAAPEADAPPSVAVATVERHEIPIILTGLGTVTPLATVTVKSEISGYLTQIAFTEGQIVHRGDLLVQIDPRPYQALLDQYEGTLAKDQALLDDARLDLARYRTLARQDSIARQNVDTQAATVRQYEGTVRADQAQVEAQKLNIAYCHITSPIDGRVGLRLVDIGNYVQASDSTGIVVVTEIMPISIVFVLPEDAVPQIRARLRAGASLPVTAFDRSNAARLADGTLATLDNEIDTSTGTLKLRAIFPNTDDALFPNQFVNARLLVDTVRDAVTVPLPALQHGAEGATVYVVGDDRKAHLRAVKTGAADGERVAVTSGLAPGERVVTDGADRLQDGASVSIAAPQS